MIFNFIESKRHDDFGIFDQPIERDDFRVSLGSNLVCPMNFGRLLEI